MCIGNDCEFSLEGEVQEHDITNAEEHSESAETESEEYSSDSDDEHNLGINDKSAVEAVCER